MRTAFEHGLISTSAMEIRCIFVSSAEVCHLPLFILAATGLHVREEEQPTAGYHSYMPR
jgi:hypothetical protein